MPHRFNSFLPRVFIWALLSASIMGCMDSTHDFKIRFHDIQGLLKGHAVYLEESVIGDVEAVEYTDSGDFLVSVAIRQEFASAVTDVCRFYIDRVPENSAQKMIRVVPLEENGNQIPEGATVEGHTKYAVLYEEFAYRLGRNMTIFESGIDAFLRELKGFSEDEQIRELERQLDDIIAELAHMSRQMKARLENEILPLLRDKIEDLRKRLEGTGQEENLDPIDRKMDQINDSLNI